MRGAAGGAAVLASSGLPAWAKPVVHAVGVRRPDSRPFPHLPAGTPTMPQIDHIVVLMMENHSFDNLLGMVPHRIPSRKDVDGLAMKKGQFLNFNRDASGHRFFAAHAGTPCQFDDIPTQSWNASHLSFNNGRNDGFVRASGPVAMRFWDDRDLPFTYSLVEHFPFGERFFCSTLTQTYPNRRFFFTGTASGLTATNLTESLKLPAANGSIFDRLDAHGINWANYAQAAPSAAIVPGLFNKPGRAARLHTDFSQFYSDVAAGKLPQYTFLDPNYVTTSSENPQDIQVGEEFIASVVHALMNAPTWKRTAFFITYDEHGGYYDHVPPPRAIKPDKIAPILSPGEAAGQFDRFGFRIPTIVVSPWAKAGYTSRVVQDLTSITAFIERKWNLPAMTFRDANAAPMTDYFDFRKPAFLKPPRLKPAPGLGPGVARCHEFGFNPPLPGAPPAPGGDLRRDLARGLPRT